LAVYHSLSAQSAVSDAGFAQVINTEPSLVNVNPLIETAPVPALIFNLETS
jgi:hypothetical protein